MKNSYSVVTKRQDLQSATKNCDTCIPFPLFNVDCKFGCWFLVSTSWHGLSDLTQHRDKLEGNFQASKMFFWNFFWNNSLSYFCNRLQIHYANKRSRNLTCNRNLSLGTTTQGLVVNQNIFRLAPIEYLNGNIQNIRNIQKLQQSLSRVIK